MGRRVAIPAAGRIAATGHTVRRIAHSFLSPEEYVFPMPKIIVFTNYVQSSVPLVKCALGTTHLEQARAESETLDFYFFTEYQILGMKVIPSDVA